MTTQLTDRILQDADAVPYQAEDPFTHSYFAFLQYFRDIPHIDVQHVIIGAHFTYGWMPTMLKLKHTHFEQAAAILNNARHQEIITDNDFIYLTGLINNSLVGVSKLLHFVNPEQYAIWDSRVASYFDPHISYYMMHHPATYRRYVQACFDVTKHNHFPALHQSINTKVGQPVSALRAVEIVMYTSGTWSTAVTTSPLEGTKHHMHLVEARLKSTR